MQALKVGAVQFQNKSGDKQYNLSKIYDLTKDAKEQGCQVVSFHECSISGYTFAQRLTKDELLQVAETVPSGESTQRLIEISLELDIVILAGLFEKDEHDNIYNTYICVNGSKVVASFRKIHPFISEYLSPGTEYVTFDIFGWTAGILICYDNNVIENVRAVALLGAQIIFMPHVTGCTKRDYLPGTRHVSPALWHNRELDPVRLRMEFDGPSGRQWLMKWLPARAYDNGIFAVFTNPIGEEDGQVKCGHSMILDPFGQILDECTGFKDAVCTAVLTAEKLTQAGGYRYRNARKVDLYGNILSKPHVAHLNVSWLNQPQE
ncbi:hypothetical protein INT43_008420 [Umbelopsis isabellina]|uniref:CN hydrolase domain-containing protein n=1 Tax=Mortierella isabellina TaxID=91625 RepID=A0A8H7PX92_MORIS|nr:hypothetical protein INT43_008420 [Umbelopsis isabellina]